MTAPLLEKMARAICEADPMQVEYEPFEGYANWHGMAQAALAVVREHLMSDEAVRLAVEQHSIDAGPYSTSEYDMRAAIRAALGDGGKA